MTSPFEVTLDPTSTPSVQRKTIKFVLDEAALTHLGKNESLQYNLHAQLPYEAEDGYTDGWGKLYVLGQLIDDRRVNCSDAWGRPEERQLIPRLHDALRKHPSFCQLPITLYTQEYSDDFLKHAASHGALAPLLQEGPLAAVQTLLDIALAPRGLSGPPRRIKITPESPSKLIPSAPDMLYAVVENFATSTRQVICVLSTKPICRAVARMTSGSLDFIPDKAELQEPVRGLTAQMIASNSPMGVFYIGADLIVLKRRYERELTIETQCAFPTAPFLEEASQKLLAPICLGMQEIRLTKGQTGKGRDERRSLGAVEAFASLFLSAEALLLRCPPELSEENRFVYALSQARLAYFLNVVTVNGACPPQVVVKLGQSDAMSYFAFGTLPTDSGRASVLLFEDNPLYTGSAARTYVGKLISISGVLKLPEWVSVRGSSNNDIRPFELYRMQTSLAEYIFSGQSGSERRVILKLPTVEPSSAVGAMAREQWGEWDENLTAARWSKAREKVNSVHMKQLKEVGQMFSNEKRAWELLSPRDGEANSSTATPISQRLFHVHLSLTPEAKRYAAAAGNAAAQQLLKAPYPIVQDHGPSLDWVIDRINGASADLQSGKSTRKSSKHPDLDDIVDELMMAGDEPRSAHRITAKLKARAQAMMDEVNAKGLVHGSVYSRNLCIQLRSRCEQGKEGEDPDGLPFVMRWIDFERSKTKKEESDFDWQVVRSRHKINDIFLDLHVALVKL